ncbi:MAG: hypothetical protein MUR36_01500, partial [Paracoccaceae bacterium]|nr:hypothetical protein [Paracoccaceae bacterium]
MPKKRIIKSDDDTVLWQRVITEVKPLKSTIELAEFAAIFAQSDHLAQPLVKPSGRPQKPPAKPARSPITAPSLAPAKKANPVD